MKIAARLESPNVIKLLGYAKHERRYFFVLEYCELGSLKDYINARGEKRLRESRAMRFARDIAAGLSILHKNDIIHRDIKPGNLFLKKEGGKMVLKIGGFSLSAITLGFSRLTCQYGSDGYRAPEINGLGYSLPVDMWSAGVVLLEMLGGCELVVALIPSTHSRPKPRDLPCSESSKRIVKHLLRRRPEKRWTSDEMLAEVEAWRDARRANTAEPDRSGAEH